MHVMVVFLLAVSILLFGGQTVHTGSAKQPAKVQEVAPVAPKAKEPDRQPVIRTHKVAEGETLSGIAEKYRLDVETIIGANPELGELLHPGEELVILPQKGVLHTVEEAETVWQLARAYEVNADVILQANRKKNDSLTVGEKLFIPGGRSLIAVSRATADRFIWPASGELSSPFGYRWGRLHAGIDIADDPGVTVKAARSGRVVFAGWRSGYGYTVMIEHEHDYVTLYAHLNDYWVSPGDYVRMGQAIACMGETGDVTGPHLHFEVRKGDKPVNPLEFLP